MRKKILAWMLTLAMVLSMCPMVAFAGNEEKQIDINIILDGITEMDKLPDQITVNLTKGNGNNKIEITLNRDENEVNKAQYSTKAEVGNGDYSVQDIEAAVPGYVVDEYSYDTDGNLTGNGFNANNATYVKINVKVSVKNDTPVQEDQKTDVIGKYDNDGNPKGDGLDDEYQKEVIFIAEDNAVLKDIAGSGVAWVSEDGKMVKDIVSLIGKDGLVNDDATGRVYVPEASASDGNEYNWYDEDDNKVTFNSDSGYSYVLVDKKFADSTVYVYRTDRIRVSGIIDNNGTIVVGDNEYTSNLGKDAEYIEKVAPNSSSSEIKFVPDSENHFMITGITINDEDMEIGENTLNEDGSYTFKIDSVTERTYVVVKTEMDPAFDGTNNPVTDVIGAFNEDGDSIGDGIDDKDQRILVFEAANATFENDSSDGAVTWTNAENNPTLIKKAVTLKGDALEAAVNVPSVNPNSGYKVGNWNPVIENGTAITVTEDFEAETKYNYAAEKKTKKKTEKVLAELEKGEHDAYILGYEDGTVRPENNISRAEVAMIFYRMLTEESRDKYHSVTNDFSDVSSDDWFNEAVSTLVNADVISGYENGTFNPNGEITRAEFATIASKFYDAEYDGKSIFKDISGHWAEDYINKASVNGLVNGYGDGSFLPDNKITRAESITLMNRTLGRCAENSSFEALRSEESFKSFRDCTEGEWFYAQIQEATNSHDYEMNKEKTLETWTLLK